MKVKQVKLFAGVLAMTLLSLVSLPSCSHPQGFSARGMVGQITYGKDGYTAELKGEDGKTFDALVSRVRMGKEYQVLQAGEVVEVSGDTIYLENRVRVLVDRIERRK